MTNDRSQTASKPASASGLPVWAKEKQKPRCGGAFSWAGLGGVGLAEGV